MNRLLFTTAILALFSPSVFAQNYDPKFNSGPDLTAFIKVATEDSTYIQFSAIPLGVVGTVSINDMCSPGLRKELLKAGAGYIYGPYPPRVLTSAVYGNAQPYASQLQQQENPTAYRLLANWQSINTTRDGLLTDADILNSKDSGLYAEGTQIDNTSVALKQEQTQYKAAVDAWNQKCVGQHPNTYCTNEYNRLQTWGKDLGNRIDANTKHIDVWKTSVKDLNSLVSTWISKVQDWENDISTFINADKSFLGGLTVCFFERAENETIPVGQPPQMVFVTACYYTCGIDGHQWTFSLSSADGYRMCPKIVTDGEIPLKAALRQSPDFASVNKLFK